MPLALRPNTQGDRQLYGAETITWASNGEFVCVLCIKEDGSSLLFRNWWASVVKLIERLVIRDTRHSASAG